MDVEAEAAHLRAARCAVQFVADHGRGKSTRLIALHARHFPSSSYIQLRTRTRTLEMPSPWPAFVDSLEHLTPRGRRRLYRSCESLACATHTCLRGELERAGYAVRTVLVGVTGVDELARIAAARVELARLNDHAPLPARARLEELHRLHGDDVRAIEHDLYLDYQRLRDEHVPLHPHDRTGQRKGLLRSR